MEGKSSLETIGEAALIVRAPSGTLGDVSCLFSTLTTQQ